MNILFCRIPKYYQSFLTQKLHDHTCIFTDDIQSYPDKENIDGLGVYVQTEVRKEDIDSFPNLKLITTISTGYDHIDVAYTKSKNIMVTNVPGYGAHSVSEFTFGLLLTLARNIHRAYPDLQDHDQLIDADRYQGITLYGKTLGVVGTGSIGKRVIAIAQGFGMKVLAYDAFPDPGFAEQHNIDYVDLKYLLGHSDIVTLHVPYLPETRHLISHKELSLMQPHALLINTARGELVHSLDVIKALKEKTIKGAAFDVLEAERSLDDPTLWSHIQSQEAQEQIRTMLIDHELIDMPNVIVTPHIASQTKEARDALYHTTVQNINAFIENNCINIVTK
jgi:D-lactate dehydrogenase